MQGNSIKKTIFTRDLKEGINITSTFLVEDKTESHTRAGQEYLLVKLRDKTGRVEARVWDRVGEIKPIFDVGDIVLVKGRVSTFNGELQIAIEELSVIDIKEVSLSDYIPSLDDEVIQRYFRELKRIIVDIDDIWCNKLLNAIFSDKEISNLFKIAPAAKQFHHAYRGGLLEHTLSVTKIARFIIDKYRDKWGDLLNGDLLITGSILHDIGKIYEISVDFPFSYTEKGRLVGHLVLGVKIVEDKIKELAGFPEDLSTRIIHLILSHHGEYELGSPRRPKVLEAIALHFIDDLDAKLNGIGTFMEQHKGKDWTSFHRLLSRYFLVKPIESYSKISSSNSLQGHEEQDVEPQGLLF